MSETCRTCRWMRPYLHNDPSEGGECMNPPPVSAVVRELVVTLRPHVTDDDYCAEWVQKERMREH